MQINTYQHLPRTTAHYRQSYRHLHTMHYKPSFLLPAPGLCSTHESWVKFDSTLTQMSRVRVESAVKIQDMSRVRVESRWLSFESELSQLDTAWVKVESLIFRRENVKILQLSVTLQRKNQHTVTFDRIPLPPGQQLFPKLGKVWWVVSQIWLNSDSNELSQSWFRLVNLGFELSRSWVRLANLGFELSRSWVTWIVIWVRVESVRKNESSTTLTGPLPDVSCRWTAFSQGMTAEADSSYPYTERGSAPVR